LFPKQFITKQVQQDKNDQDEVSPLVSEENSS